MKWDRPPFPATAGVAHALWWPLEAGGVGGGRGRHLVYVRLVHVAFLLQHHLQVCVRLLHKRTGGGGVKHGLASARQPCGRCPSPRHSVTHRTSDALSSTLPPNAVALTSLTDEETEAQRSDVTIMTSPPQLRGRADTDPGLLAQAGCMTLPGARHLPS